MRVLPTDLPYMNLEENSLYVAPVDWNQCAPFVQGPECRLPVRVNFRFNDVDIIVPGLSMYNEWRETWYMVFTLKVDDYAPIVLRTIEQDEDVYPYHEPLGSFRELDYTWYVPITFDMALGAHELTLEVQVFAVYYVFISYPYAPPYYAICEQQATMAPVTIVVIDGAPDCGFTFTPSGGPAPLAVQFTNLSTSPIEDVTWSYAWSFGDGGTSTLKDPSHVFEEAGEYYVGLAVATEYGGDSCAHAIIVEAAECFPQFTSCWTPSPVAVGESFSPRLRIRNQGTGCNIWIKAEVEGRFKTLVSSRYLGDYEEIDVEIDPHTVSWYLDYTPDEPMIMYLRFWTGPAGEDPGHPHTWYCDLEVYVTVEEPPPPPVKAKTLLLVGAGLVVAGGGLILLRRGK